MLREVWNRCGAVGFCLLGFSLTVSGVASASAATEAAEATAETAGASGAKAYEERDRKGADESALSLQSALDTALAHNLGLVAERYRVPNARDDVAAEAAAFDFELFGNASLSERQAAARASALDDAVTPESENRAASVGADKRLRTGATVTAETDLTRSWSNNNAARNPDYAGGVGLNFRQPLWKDAWPKVNLAPLARARASAEQTLFELRSVVLDVLADTEIAYWNLAYARAERELAASRVKLAETLLRENRERERLGLVTPLEVLQAETELVTQQETVLRAERRIDDAVDALRRRLGEVSFLESPGSEGPAVSDLPERISGPPPMRDVVNAAVRFDADAKAQERAVEVRRINRLLAEDETRPSVDLVGGLGYSGRDKLGEEAFRGAYSGDGYRWNLGVELRFPWGFRAENARLRQTERNLEREKVRLYDLKQEKALAARNTWRALDTGLQRVEVTRKAVRLNRRNFEQERARYQAGEVPFRTVQEAQRDYDAARSNHLTAVIETLRARVRLSRVDGSILERNGYQWEDLEGLRETPATDSHPLLGNVK